MDANLEQEKIKLEIEEAELDFLDFLKTFSWYSRYFLYFLAIGIIPVFFIVKYSVANFYLAGFSTRQITAHSASLNSQPAEVLKSAILPLGGKNFSAYAQIKNPNPDLVAPDISYVFDFKDASGKSLARVVEHTFLLGGEVKYMIVPHVTLAAKPENLDVQITNAGWHKRIQLPDVKINTGVPRSGDQQNPDGYFVQGDFRNLSIYTLHQVRINGIVFGKTGEIIAVSQSTANDIAPQQQRSYFMFWPFALASNTSKADTYLETNILDPTNLK